MVICSENILFDAS